MAVRYKVKRGTLDSLTAVFDTTNLPSGSLSNLQIDWYVKRDITQPYYDIVKSTTTGAIIVTDALNGIINVLLTPADTQSLPAGDYLWAFKLSSTPLNVLTISPDTLQGDLILLDSAVF